METRSYELDYYGFNSCIVISVYPLDMPLIKKATEYCYN